MRTALPWCVALLLLGASACSPLYLPPGATLPQLGQAGEVQASAVMGLHGLSLGGAVALTDTVALRGAGFGRNGSNSSGPALYAQGGAGLYWASGGEGRKPGEFRAGNRFSVAVDVGLGSAQYGTPGLSGFQSATLLRGSLEGELGWVSELVGLGLAPRVTVVKFTPAANSRAGSEALMLYLEPMVLVRLGRPMLRFELQAGLSLPNTLSGTVSGFMPLMMGVGVSSDFGAWERTRRAEVLAESRRQRAAPPEPLPGAPLPPPPPAPLLPEPALSPPPPPPP